MRSSATSHAATATRVPRGWAILGLALASWILAGGVWAMASQLFNFVAAAL